MVKHERVVRSIPDQAEHPHPSPPPPHRLHPIYDQHCQPEDHNVNKYRFKQIIPQTTKSRITTPQYILPPLSTYIRVCYPLK